MNSKVTMMSSRGGLANTRNEMYRMQTICMHEESDTWKKKIVQFHRWLYKALDTFH